MNAQTVESSSLATRTDLRRFRPELTPTWVSAALLCTRHRQWAHSSFGAVFLDGSTSFGSWTAPVAAACHPEANMITWSPHPTALTATEALRRAADLANLTVHESPEPPGPESLGSALTGGRADLVVIDGILDTADDQLRAGLLDCVSSTLRPGGTVCVRYRTTVGWSEILPVLRLVRHMVARDPRPPLDAVPDVFGLLRQLRSATMGYLVERPAVVAWLDGLLSMSASDVVAGYIDADLRPLSHAQVRAAMASIGCDYVGSSQVGDALSRGRSEATGKVVDSVAAPVLREAFDDLSVRRSHRTDLFQLGPDPMSNAEQRRAVGLLSVIGLPGAAESTAGSAVGRPKRPVTKALLRALAGGPVTMAELEPDASLRVGLLRRLMADGIAHPVMGGELTGASDGAVTRLNRILSRPPTPVRDRIVVSPLIGSAVVASQRPDRGELARLGVR